MPPIPAMFKGIDTTSRVTTQVAGLHAHDVKLVLKYIASTGAHPFKSFDRSEILALWDSGIRTGYLFETVSELSMFAPGNAETHFKAAAAKLKADKRKAGTICYWCGDEDLTEADAMERVRPYLKAGRPIMLDAGFRVGWYGDGDSCQILKEEGLVHSDILANAGGWTGSASYFGWDLRQTTEPAPLGLDADVLHGRMELLQSLFPDPEE